MVTGIVYVYLFALFVLLKIFTDRKNYDVTLQFILLCIIFVRLLTIMTFEHYIMIKIELQSCVFPLQK